MRLLEHSISVGYSRQSGSFNAAQRDAQPQPSSAASYRMKVTGTVTEHTQENAEFAEKAVVKEPQHVLWVVVQLAMENTLVMGLQLLWPLRNVHQRRLAAKGQFVELIPVMGYTSAKKCLSGRF
ncbi:hypothetical protein CEXT_56831 [Caerostris extrusa]|uniref:Uncharacterized protein n=1 Tax=Caerostris extrusa TaxID=172846 RepID=A0AAV4TUU8_CAEEX|nr:hypothetical protein CEXT_56831 [Caerostris extrusa]